MFKGNQIYCLLLHSSNSIRPFLQILQSYNSPILQSYKSTILQLYNTARYKYNKDKRNTNNSSSLGLGMLQCWGSSCFFWFWFWFDFGWWWFLFCDLLGELILNMCDFSRGCCSNEISQEFRRGVPSLLICWLRRIGIDNDVRVAASGEAEVSNGVHQEMMRWCSWLSMIICSSQSLEMLHLYIEKSLQRSC
jgi:hypothetical protein